MAASSTPTAGCSLPIRRRFSRRAASLHVSGLTGAPACSSARGLQPGSSRTFPRHRSPARRDTARGEPREGGEPARGDTRVSSTSGDSHDIARSVGDIERDLAEEARDLSDSIKHDYSTSTHGIVPLTRRRPLWHFAALWLTFSSGFSYLFLGFVIHDGGNSLLSTVWIVLLGCAFYFVYVMAAAYLGSRTGQTHTLLTRSIFGITGSGLVSLFIFIGAVGWAGFQANLTAQIWDGLFGWGHVELLGIILGVVMVFNNILGFTGISVFARYIATPILLIWVIYLVIKGLVSDYSSLTGTPKATAGGLSLWPAVGVVRGSLASGNEPDIWRYGKPRFWWPTFAFVFSFIAGLLLCTAGGWMMAALAHTSNFGP